MTRYFFVYVVLAWAVQPWVYSQEDAQKKLAICHFEARGDATTQEGEMVADMITSAIKTQQYRLIERPQIKKILDEKFARRNVLNDDEIAEFVRVLDVDYAMLGCVEKRENMYNSQFALQAREPTTSSEGNSFPKKKTSRRAKLIYVHALHHVLHLVLRRLWLS